MKFLSPTIKQRFFDANGDPLSGGKVYTYAAGSTTPKATFQDHLGVTANTNPIVLDANGECDIWLTSGNYKIILKDSDDVEQWSVDYVSSTSAGDAGTDAQTISNVIGGEWYAPAGSGAVEDEEFGLKVFKFPSPEDASNIVINISFKIPENYNGGDIEVRLGAYSPNYSTSLVNNQPTFQFQLTAALVKKHVTDADQGFRVDDLTTSEVDSVQISAIPAYIDQDTMLQVDGKPYVYRPLVFVLADAGTIDGETVGAGDYVFLQITRIPYTPDDSLYIEDTEQVRIKKDFMEIICS